MCFRFEWAEKDRGDRWICLWWRWTSLQGIYVLVVVRYHETNDECIVLDLVTYQLNNYAGWWNASPNIDIQDHA